MKQGTCDEIVGVLVIIGTFVLILLIVTLCQGTDTVYDVKLYQDGKVVREWKATNVRSDRGTFHFTPVGGNKMKVSGTVIVVEE